MDITKALLFSTLLALAATGASAQIYRVVDEDGRVTYTDTPPGDEASQETRKSTSEKLSLPSINIQPGTEIAPREASDDGDQVSGYRYVAIAAPEDDTTIPPGQLEVSVQVAMEPDLKPGHRVLLHYNDEPHGEPTTSTRFVLSELIRGSYPIRAEILDQEGTVVAASEPVTLHVKRHSRLH